MKRARLLLLSLTLLGCSGADGLLTSREWTELSLAEGRWKSRAFADYTFETRLDCFCPPEITEWNRVSVRNGVIVQAERLTTPPTPSNVAWFETIDSTFAHVRRDAQSSGFRDTYRDIAVAFDAALGFPTAVSYYERPGIADAGMTRSIRNVSPLP